MTTGAWYAEGTKLHLLLPNYHAPVNMNNEREVLNQDPLFEVLNATRYEFVPSSFATKHSNDASLLSLLQDETPHLIIEYEKLLETISRVDQNQGKDAAGQPIQPLAPDTMESQSTLMDEARSPSKSINKERLNQP